MKGKDGHEHEGNKGKNMKGKERFEHEEKEGKTI